MFNRQKKQKKQKKYHIPLRVNILFFIVFVMFSVLILRLGVTQIVRGEDFQNQLASQVSNIVTQSVPRGVIYDRHNNVVVGNAPQRTITYTRSSNVTRAERLETAEELARLIDMDTSSLTERDKQDFWITRNSEKARELVSTEEAAQIRATGEEEGKSSTEIQRLIDQRQRERITEEMLAEFSEHDLEVLAIFSRMSGGTTGVPQIIKSGSMTRNDKNDVTDEEFARVSENLANLPGVDTTIDWQRTYPFDRTLRTILGNVSTSNEGLPSDRIDHFLVRGYNRNDRVGTSYIEQVFEDVLHGTKTQLEVNKDDNGNIVEQTVVYEGAAGNSLVLTLDIEFQQKVEEIVENELRAIQPGNPHADRAFVVAMDPQTGEILSLVGKQLVRNEETGQKEMRDFALGTFTTAYTMGSSVKGATVLMAWQNGATQPGQYILDERLHFRGTQDMGSWTVMGRINDLTALARSSNVYMFKSVMAMSGTTYVRNGPLRLRETLLDEMRYYFNQFGLGVKTGIDLPNESAGQLGQGSLLENPGIALFYSIGQYDTYTALQLAQYVATIANGGYRMQPQIVREIREPSTTEDELPRIIEATTPTVLNRVDMKTEWVERVQRGFKYTMQRNFGTAYQRFRSAPYNPAGKTGTAQAHVNGVEVTNHTLVAYAPADNPEIAISVVVPWLTRSSSSNQIIGRAVLDAFFELQQQREKITE